MSLKRFLHLALALAFASQSLFNANVRAQVASQAQPAVAAAQDDLASRVAAIEKAFDEKRVEAGVPGASLVVVRGDQIVVLKGSGMRDAARSLPVTPDTLFAIGSCTKAFTALAAVMAQDDGKLSLDDAPKKYLPYFKLADADADARVTLRDLLTHRTGLAGTDIAWYTGVLNREEVIRAAGRAKATARLREKFQYQNVMYSAAGETVARAEGTTWEDLISSRILKPLGMSKTVLTLRELQAAPDYSLGYEYDAKIKQARQLPTRDLSNIAPAGAINSSAREMAQWLKFLVARGVAPNGKRLVSEKGFDEILTPQIKLNATTDYALGWGVIDFHGRKVYVHNGGIDGFGSEVAFLPQEKIGLALLANVEETPLLSGIISTVVKNLLDATPQQTANPQTKISDALKELVGTYEIAPGGKVEVLIKDGKVVLSVPGQPDYPLVEKERDVYSSPILPDTYSVRARRDATGKISSIVLKQPEGEFELKRTIDAPATDNKATTPNVSAPVATPTPVIAVEELMSKMIAAAGGEANLRRHKSMITTAAVTFENQGLDGEETTYAQSPNAYAREVAFTSSGKRIGTTREFFDGTSGGEETSFNAAGEQWDSSKIAEVRAAADFYALLNWKTLYKKIEVKGLEKEAGEDAYVVVYTPEKGPPATEYVSARTFLVLRRVSLSMPAAGGDVVAIETRFSDYHNVSGVLVPFTLTYNVPGTGDSTARIREVKFDAAITPDTFRARVKK
jgi:CubicO group peptidase (beta-lactamase class C family)